MKNVGLISLSLVIILGGVALLDAETNPYDKYLTLTDVQTAGKLTGIKSVPRDPNKGAGGELNFALADGTMVLIVNFLTLDAKGYPVYKNQMKPYINAAVPGLGEDAFDGPGGAVQYFLTFRKGTWVVSLSTFFGPSGKTFLSMDQLKALAKVVLGRL
jgi:hypothetical protein